MSATASDMPPELWQRFVDELDLPELRCMAQLNRIGNSLARRKVLRSIICSPNLEYSASQSSWTFTLSRQTERLKGIALCPEAVELVEIFHYSTRSITDAVQRQIKKSKVLRDAYHSFLGAMSTFLAACHNLSAITIEFARLDERGAQALRSLKALKEVHLQSADIPWDEHDISSSPLRLSKVSVSNAEDAVDSQPDFFSGIELMSLRLEEEDCVNRVLSKLLNEGRDSGTPLQLTELTVEVSDATAPLLMEFLGHCPQLQALAIMDYRYTYTFGAPISPLSNKLSSLCTYSGPTDLARPIIFGGQVTSIVLNSGHDSQFEGILRFLHDLHISKTHPSSIELFASCNLQNFHDVISEVKQHCPYMKQFGVRFDVSDDIKDPASFHNFSGTTWTKQGNGKWFCQISLPNR